MERKKNLNKLIFWYSFLITLSSIHIAADVNKKHLPNKMQYHKNTTTSVRVLFDEKQDKTWQPFIPTLKWLPQSATATPPSLPLSLATGHNLNLKLQINSNDNYKHNRFYKSNQHNNKEQKYMYQSSDNNRDFVNSHINSTMQMPIDSGKHIKLKPLLSKVSNNGGNQRQRWQLYNPSNNMETLYSQITIPSDIVSVVHQQSHWQQAHIQQQGNEKNLISSQFNRNHHVKEIRNVQHHQYHNHSQNPLPYQRFASKTRRHISSTDTSNKNSKEIENLNGILESSSNGSVFNKTFENIHGINISPTRGFKSDNLSLPFDENQFKNVGMISGDKDGNLDIKSMPLRTTSNDKIKHYDDCKKVICNNKGHSYGSESSETGEKNVNERNKNESKTELCANKNKIDNNNHLKIIKFPPKQLVLKTISAMPDSAAAVEVKEKIDLLNIHKIRQPSSMMASANEVQGHQTQNDKDLFKHSLESPASRQLMQMQSKSSATTSKSLSTNELISARKVKKKFKKFLLPLLLAYKLKFIALLPLLVGGLVLLVGTTGMAGFFFALFTAVMTLKASSRNAIVVKKY